MDKISHHPGKHSLGAKNAEFSADYTGAEKREAAQDSISAKKNQPTPNSLHQLLESHDIKSTSSHFEESEGFIDKDKKSISHQAILKEFVKSASPSDLTKSVRELRQDYYTNIIIEDSR